MRKIIFAVFLGCAFGTEHAYGLSSASLSSVVPKINAASVANPPASDTSFSPNFDHVFTGNGYDTSTNYREIGELNYNKWYTISKPITVEAVRGNKDVDIDGNDFNLAPLSYCGCSIDDENICLNCLARVYFIPTIPPALCSEFMNAFKNIIACYQKVDYKKEKSGIEVLLNALKRPDVEQYNSLQPNKRLTRNQLEIMCHNYAEYAREYLMEKRHAMVKIADVNLHTLYIPKYYYGSDICLFMGKLVVFANALGIEIKAQSYDWAFII